MGGSILEGAILARTILVSSLHSQTSHIVHTVRRFTCGKWAFINIIIYANLDNLSIFFFFSVHSRLDQYFVGSVGKH